MTTIRLAGTYEKILKILYEKKEEMERNDLASNGDHRAIVMQIKTLERLTKPVEDSQDFTSFSLDKELIKNLVGLGLSESESKIYSFLIQDGNPRCVREIVQATKIPRLEIYRVVRNLEKKGLAETAPYVGGINRRFHYAKHPSEDFSSYAQSIIAPITEAREKALTLIKKYSP